MLLRRTRESTRRDPQSNLRLLPLNQLGILIRDGSGGNKIVYWKSGNELFSDVWSMGYYELLSCSLAEAAIQRSFRDLTLVPLH